MKLYQSVGPNPRVATMFIAEKGVTIERVMLDIMAGENRQGDYLTKNPRGGSPCLELDDGSFLDESVAICEYLEEKYPSPPLIGLNAEDRAHTRAALRWVDQQVVVPMTNGFRSAEGLPMFQPRMLCIPEASDANKAYARDGLTKADARLAGQDYLCGKRFTLADILLFCFVEFGTQVGQPIPDGCNNIKAWQARVAARPSAVISANPKNGL
ncbi:MAG: glutathione S-transferase family protein [Sphingorhabdus sp.]